VVVTTDEREEQHPVPEDEDGYAQRERRFRQLYQEHYRSVQAYAVRRADAGADVADTVAEVFTTAWRRLADIPPPPADRLWLYGVARRVLAGQHRSSRRFRRLIDRIQLSYDPRPQAAELLPDSPNEPLILALRQLPATEREALMLVLWEQLSHAEAGQVLGCSANAVAIRVHRAKARLREALAPAPPEAAVPSNSYGR
jgi:RNA polymerase sigma-70 factor, ECF subfamily